MERALHLKAVGKSFGSKIVLDNLNCDFPAGKVYALLGENGAGKSTLAALISGESKADSGTIDFQNIYSCALVHQRPLLADRLNVRDNIILGSEPARFSCSRLEPFGVSQRGKGFFGLTDFFDFVDFKKARCQIDALLKEWKLPVNPLSRIPPLSAQERFFTALASALYKNPDILILDEPGAVLNIEQKQALYPAFKNYASKGKIVILITHNTDDALEYADGILILRAGRKAAFLECTGNTCTVLNRSYIESLVFARTTDSAASARSPASQTSPDSGRPAVSAVSEGDENASPLCESSRAHCTYKDSGAMPVLSVKNLSCVPNEGSPLYDISFEVYPGTITCMYGHRENGLETLENLLTGMKKLEYTGSILIEGKRELHPQTKRHTGSEKHTDASGPGRLRSFGAGIVPFNRTFRASNPALTVEQILTVYLKHEDKVDSASYARSLILRAGIHIGIEERASALSGGMLQRLIIEREIDAFKKLLILSEPERGLDVNAAAALTRRLQRAADEGTGILLFVSSGSFARFESCLRYSIRGGRLYET
ncbi:ATP-binding cassette domain-containing protein [Treponema sp. OMZ 840]|uniref:ATP-binding cassette domain-containing protein n=1 Tax=Treponema sp. OMZ 840 TaxID=244313 RepID=UPI003D8B6429